MVNKIFTRLKEILTTKIDPQEMIVVLLFGGFGFLIQATITPNQNLVIGYLVYVVIASLSFMFMNWDKKMKESKK